MRQKLFTFFSHTKLLFYIVFLINLGLVIAGLYQKQAFHSDEQWSYAHANSSHGAYLDVGIDSFYELNDEIKQRLYDHWIDGKVFHDYLTVQPDERFSYKNIYHNLEVVEHPPLYFILIHTICSFFPDCFSKWYAGSINILSFILIYIFLFKLANIFLKNDWLALYCVALWGFSGIGLATAIYLRMYVLQTLLFLCLLYQTSQILLQDKVQNKQIFLIFLYSFLGIFCQYSSIFLSFFVALTSGIILLFHKKYKLLLKFEMAMAMSLLMLFLLFPTAYDILFHSLRGSQVLYNLASFSAIHNVKFSLYEIDIRLSYFMQMFSEQFLPFSNTNYKLFAFVIIVGFVLMIFFKCKFNLLTKWLISIWILYFLYLLAMPYMHAFHSRFYMCLMPVMSLFLVMSIRNLATNLRVKENQIIIFIAFLVMINSLVFALKKNPYAFTYHAAEQNISQNIQGKPVFIDSVSNVIFLHSMVYLLAKADKVFVFDDICNEKLHQNILQTPDPIVLTYNSYIFQNLIQDNPSCLKKIGLSNISKICASQYCYLVWQKNKS